jgi:hypothetical protein
VSPTAPKYRARRSELVVDIVFTRSYASDTHRVVHQHTTTPTGSQP